MTVIAALAPMTVARSNVARPAITTRPLSGADKAAVLAAARAQVDAWKRAV